MIRFSGTVEDYQGQERSVTVLSAVRSQRRFVEEDIKKGLGVIGQPKRLNVALTRAQAGLVIVGNPDVLMVCYWLLVHISTCRTIIHTIQTVQHDSDWRKLLIFYCKHRLNRGYMPKIIVQEASRSASPTSPYRPGQLEQGHIYAMHVKQTRQQEWLGSRGEWAAEEEDEKALGWSIDTVSAALEEWGLEDYEEEGVQNSGEFMDAY